jgi:hypothetical protein
MNLDHILSYPILFFEDVRKTLFLVDVCHSNLTRLRVGCRS